MFAASILGNSGFFSVMDLLLEFFATVKSSWSSLFFFTSEFEILFVFPRISYGYPVASLAKVFHFVDFLKNKCAFMQFFSFLQRIPSNI